MVVVCDAQEENPDLFKYSMKTTAVALLLSVVVVVRVNKIWKAGEEAAVIPQFHFPCLFPSGACVSCPVAVPWLQHQSLSLPLTSLSPSKIFLCF